MDINSENVIVEDADDSDALPIDKIIKRKTSVLEKFLPITRKKSNDLLNKNS